MEVDGREYPTIGDFIRTMEVEINEMVDTTKNLALSTLIKEVNFEKLEMEKGGALEW